MKPLNYTVFLLVLLFLFLGCKKDNEMSKEITTSDCWRRSDGKIVFTQLSEPTITPPSKITVFFKLDDKDGRPIANLSEDNFRIYEETASGACLQNISQFEAARKVSQEKKYFTHTTLIVLDLSGSVLANFSEELKTATKSLVNEIRPDSVAGLTEVGVYWFDGAADLHELIAPTFEKADVLAQIETINASLSKDNSTNLYGAVSNITKQANEILDNSTIVSGVSILLFTDGIDRANRISKDIAYSAVDSSNAAISFFTVGLGSDTNEQDLKKFGRDKYVNISAVSELTSTFSSIAQSVEDESNSYYLFEYCSPIRGGTANTLIIEANTTDKKGYLESTFNAEGFEGGCSL